MNPKSEGPASNHSTIDIKQNSIIDPQALINDFGLAGLNRNSDEYYKRLPLPEYQMGKPFTMPSEAPQILVRLGLLLENFRLGPGMTVLDFGAGTCWLSKAIWQMGCNVIAVDVSETCLQLGQRLFNDFPIPHCSSNNWEMRVFNGERLPLENGEVDRIICFDTFHHVPNQRTVVAEFFRVLKDGGMIALNEPLGNHSSTLESQKEMRNYSVLENDLDMDALSELFQSFGFATPKFKATTTPGLLLTKEERKQCVARNIPETVVDSIKDSVRDGGIFYFPKGEAVTDSRTPVGLSHEIRLEPSVSSIVLSTVQVFDLQLQIRNTGSATWLSDPKGSHGSVKIGTQLLDPNTLELVKDHGRFPIFKDRHADDTFTVTIPLTINRPGKFMLRIDLVSELVCWFHQLGSDEVLIEVDVS